MGQGIAQQVHHRVLQTLQHHAVGLDIQARHLHHHLLARGAGQIADHLAEAAEDGIGRHHADLAHFLLQIVAQLTQRPAGALLPAPHAAQFAADAGQGLFQGLVLAFQGNGPVVIAQIAQRGGRGLAGPAPGAVEIGQGAVEPQQRPGHLPLVHGLGQQFVGGTQQPVEVKGPHPHRFLGAHRRGGRTLHGGLILIILIRLGPLGGGRRGRGRHDDPLRHRHGSGRRRLHAHRVAFDHRLEGGDRGGGVGQRLIGQIGRHPILDNVEHLTQADRHVVIQPGLSGPDLGEQRLHPVGDFLDGRQVHRPRRPLQRVGAAEDFVQLRESASLRLVPEVVEQRADGINMFPVFDLKGLQQPFADTDQSRYFSKVRDSFWPSWLRSREAFSNWAVVCAVCWLA